MSSVCRVCCESGNRIMIRIRNKKIIQTFENLTNLKFQSAGRPKVICTSCYDLLLSCTNLNEMDRHSRRIFNELAVKGLEPTRDAIDELKLAMIQHLSIVPVKIAPVKIARQDGTTKSNKITEEVSITVERLENPLTESAVWEKND